MSRPTSTSSDFADLARFWPEGVGVGARRWLLANIPVGTARNGHFELASAAPVGLTSVELTRASGALDGVGLQVHWLRPIPPIDNGQAQLRIVDPDTLDIIVTGGRQRLRNQKETSPAGLQIRGGKVRITGIMQPRQVGVIEAEIAGPVPDALALLREPRLSLLSRHPIDLKNPAGLAGRVLQVYRMPGEQGKAPAPRNSAKASGTGPAMSASDHTDLARLHDTGDPHLAAGGSASRRDWFPSGCADAGVRR